MLENNDVISIGNVNECTRSSYFYRFILLMTWKSSGSIFRLKYFKSNIYYSS